MPGAVPTFEFADVSVPRFLHLRTSKTLGRARKHIDDLEAEILAFWASIPYLIEEVGSLKTGLGAYRGREHRRFQGRPEVPVRGSTRRA